jgi:MoaA/NifB/PqqE/SkfB family radical SAM enzyme
MNAPHDIVWNRYPTEQRLCINLLLRCNLSCAHCNVHSDPTRTERLSFDVLEDLLRKGWDLGKRHVTYSGGEVFLDADLLLAGIRTAAGLGYAVDVETNAFWARTESSAHEQLQKLVSAGARGLILSADGFHTRLMPLQKTIIAARIAKRLGLLVEVNYCPSDDAIEDAAILATLAAEGVEPLINPLLAIGRARDVSNGVGAETTVDRLPDCDSRMTTVHANGQIYSCCEIDDGGAIDPPPIRCGHVSAVRFGLDEIAHYAALLQAFYSPGSPGYFRDLIRTADLFTELADGRYRSICDLCRRCFSSTARLQSLERIVLGSQSG